MVRKVYDVVTFGKVAKASRKCEACGLTIDRDAWYTVMRRLGVNHTVHDGEYCCARLLVRLGLAQPNFYSNVTPDYLESKAIN